MYCNTPFHIFYPKWLSLQLWQDPCPQQLPIRMECWQEAVQQNTSHPTVLTLTHTHTTGSAQICCYFMASSDVLYLLKCKADFFPQT